MAANAVRILLLALMSAAPAFAVETLPLTAAQKSNLGIQTIAASAPSSALAMTYPARVSFPPSSVRVIAAAGEALVTRLHVQAGDAVKRGTPLVTLSMPGLAEAQNALTQARLHSKLASNNAVRDEKLFAEGLIAESRLRATQSEAQSGRANLSAAQAALNMLGGGKVSGSTLTLNAPISGVVTESMTEPGSRVDAGMALLKLADLSKLALDIPLSTTQARQVAVGQSVAVAGSDARGRITALLPQLSASQSVLVRASLVDPQKLLRPGQSVQVSIAGERSADSMVLPSVAVVWKVDKPYVFVESEQGFVPTPVQVIRRNANQVSVTGLTVGSSVAIKGVAALKAQWLEE